MSFGLLYPFQLVAYEVRMLDYYNEATDKQESKLERNFTLY